MNIHELNYVLCIAKHQNMTKAAQELFISQPTLSKHLGKLERELGIKLFSRVDNCYIPTYAGRRYMEYASGVLELTRDWEKELADLRSQNDGELNVAFPLMRSSCMIPRILPAFRRIHPNIRLNFLEETYAIQERLLTDSRIDFAIFSDGSLNPKLEYETLGHEEILLAVCPRPPHHHAPASAVLAGRCAAARQTERRRAAQGIPRQSARADPARPYPDARRVLPRRHSG